MIDRSELLRMMTPSRDTWAEMPVRISRFIGFSPPSRLPGSLMRIDATSKVGAVCAKAAPAARVAHKNTGRIYMHSWIKDGCSATRLAEMITRRAILAAALLPAARLRAQTRVERWDVHDVNLDGPRDGNPFLDVRLSATFRNQHRAVEVDGFYDGNGAYKVRFSPDSEGEWSYTTRSNRRELDGKTGSFACTRPAASNHGPVGVRNTFHFGYADGKPYFPFGTTCYAW